MTLNSLAATAPKFNGVKVLALLFANLDPERTYPADAGVWTQAVRELRDDWDATYPELFEDISFVEQPGAKPYSPDVSEFLTRMQAGARVEVPNPAYVILRIKPSVQSDMLALYSRNPGFSTALSAVKEMVGPLMEKLQVASPDSISV